MNKPYNIAVIAGDGTGPEVIREGLKVLQAAAKKYNFKYETKMFDFGGEGILRPARPWKKRISPS